MLVNHHHCQQWPEVSHKEEEANLAATPPHWKTAAKWLGCTSEQIWQKCCIHFNWIWSMWTDYVNLQRYTGNGCTWTSSGHQAVFSPPMQHGNEASLPVQNQALTILPNIISGSDMSCSTTNHLLQTRFSKSYVVPKYKKKGAKYLRGPVYESHAHLPQIFRLSSQQWPGHDPCVPLPHPLLPAGLRISPPYNLAQCSLCVCVGVHACTCVCMCTWMHVLYVDVCGCRYARTRWLL